jgi:hypothetical protein
MVQFPAVSIPERLSQSFALSFDTLDDVNEVLNQSDEQLPSARDELYLSFGTPADVTDTPDKLIASPWELSDKPDAARDTSYELGQKLYLSLAPKSRIGEKPYLFSDPTHKLRN